MDSALLRRFIVMAEAGSLSKAAALLDITQPALSRTLQSLEQHYGAELLRRGAAGVVLTPFGQVVLKRAKLVQAELRHIETEISALRNLAVGQVHVGIPSGVGFTSGALPAATLRLLTDASRLEIAYTIGTQIELVAALRRGDLDFVVADIGHVTQSPDLVHESMFSDRSAIVARAEHPLAKKRVVAIADLFNYHWAVMADSSALEEALRRIAAERGRVFDGGTLRSNSALFMRSIVAKSDAIGLMSHDAIRPDILKGTAVELNVQDPKVRIELPTHDFSVIYRRDAVLSTAALALIAELQKEYAPASARPPRRPRPSAGENG